MAFGFNVTRVIAGASTNATLVKALRGEVCGWSLGNSAAYAVFFKLYNSATIPTAGVGTPVMTIECPAGITIAQNFGGANGVAFDAGIGFTITKLIADSDATVLVANDLVVNLFWL